MRSGMVRFMGNATSSRVFSACSTRLEAASPRGGGGESFPTIGKKVSNHWKNFFQSLEKCGKFFPIVGKPAKIFSNRWKIRVIFSNHWKVFFQSLENGLQEGVR